MLCDLDRHSSRLLIDETLGTSRGTTTTLKVQLTEICRGNKVELLMSTSKRWCTLGVVNGLGIAVAQVKGVSMLLHLFRLGVVDTLSVEQCVAYRQILDVVWIAVCVGARFDLLRGASVVVYYHRVATGSYIRTCVRERNYTTRHAFFELCNVARANFGKYWILYFL